jgi:hypothetical protein
MVVFKCDWTDASTSPNWRFKILDADWKDDCTNGGLVSEKQPYVMNEGLRRIDSRCPAEKILYPASHQGIGFYSTLRFWTTKLPFVSVLL